MLDGIQLILQSELQMLNFEFEDFSCYNDDFSLP